MKLKKIKKINILSINTTLVLLLVLLLAPLVFSNETIYEGTYYDEKKTDYLPGFNLKIPLQDEIKIMQKETALNKNSQIEENAIEENTDVIVILKEPEFLWDEKEIKQLNVQEIKSAMRNYVQDQVNNKHDIKKELQIINGFSAKLTQDEIRELEKNPLVEKIEPDREVRTTLHDSVNIIGASNAWNYNTQNSYLNGDGETICIIDTGIDYTHEDLGGAWGIKVIGGFNTLNSEIINCNDNNTACLDTASHGTHIAGIISANGEIKGVAPNTKLFVIKALSGSTGSSTDIIQGIELCTSHREEYNISIISMSLGTIKTYKTFCDEEELGFSKAINNATQEGILVIASTGNNKLTNEIIAPACVKNTIRVGSSTKEDEIAILTNTWAHDMILAPGTSINSTTLSGMYELKSGTSMATPHVTGAIAIILQYHKIMNQDIQKDQIFNLLNFTGDVITKNNRDFSRINIDNTLINLTNLNIDIKTPNKTIYNETNIPLNITYKGDAAQITYTINNQIYTFQENKILNLDDGEYVLSAKIIKNDTYKKTNDKIFLVDATPPKIIIEKPENKTYNLFEQELVISASDKNLKKIIYNYDGANKSYTEPVIMTFGEGAHTIHAWAEDIAGNINYTTTTFTIKTTPPIISNTVLNATVTRSDSLIKLNVNIVESAPIMTIHLNNVELTGSNTIYELFFKTKDFGCEADEGVCKLKLEVIDKNNHRAEKYINITYDDIAPRISIVSPKNVAYNKTTHRLYINSEDANLKSVIYNYDGANKTYTEPVNITLSEGEHTIAVWAEDVVGNKNYTYIKSTIDLTAPSVTIMQPYENETYETDKIDINFFVEDNLSESMICKVYVNNKLKLTKQASNSTNIIINTNTFNLNNDDYELEISCEDEAGNIGFSQVNFGVDKQEVASTNTQSANTGGGGGGSMVATTSAPPVQIVESVLVNTSTTRSTMKNATNIDDETNNVNNRPTQIDTMELNEAKSFNLAKTNLSYLNEKANLKKSLSEPIQNETKKRMNQTILIAVLLASIVLVLHLNKMRK